MSVQSILNEINTNDPVVQAIKKDISSFDETDVLDRLNDIEQSIGEIRELMLAKLPISAGGMGGRSFEEIDEILEGYDIRVYEAEDLPGQFGFTNCDADDYLSMEAAAVAAMQYVSEANDVDFG